MGSTVELDDKVVFRVSKKLKDALAKAARDDGRKMSNLAVHILSSWLEEHGYLERSGSKKGVTRR